MANELLSVVEALALRKRLAAAEARAEHAERELEALRDGPKAGLAVSDLDALFASIASQHFNARLDDETSAALRAAFDAGWESKRARDEQLLEQANATAAKRTSERDLAERERDHAARAMVKAQIRCKAEMRETERLHAELDEQRQHFAMLSKALHDAHGHLSRIRIAAAIGETDDMYDVEYAVIERLGALQRLLGMVEAAGMPTELEFRKAVRLALAVLIARGLRPIAEEIADDASTTVAEVMQWRNGESAPHEFTRKAVFAAIARHARAQVEAGEDVRRTGWIPPDEDQP